MLLEVERSESSDAFGRNLLEVNGKNFCMMSISDIVYEVCSDLSMNSSSDRLPSLEPVTPLEAVSPCLASRSKYWLYAGGRAFHKYPSSFRMFRTGSIAGGCVVVASGNGK